MKKTICLLSILSAFSAGCWDSDMGLKTTEATSPYKLLETTMVWVVDSRIYLNESGSRPKFTCVLELKIATGTALHTDTVPIDAYNAKITVNEMDENVTARLSPFDQGAAGSHIAFRRAEIFVPSKEMAQKFTDSISECKKRAAENAPIFR